MAKVLVVDDELQVALLLATMLHREGHDVVTFADGEAVLDSLGAEPPDLVLLDVMLPGINGFEVCRRLKDNPVTRLTPVVMLTGLGEPESRIRGIESGADEFLTKPFDHAEFLARIRSLLKMKTYTDELDRAESVLLALARSIEARDPYTQDHCERLSAYGTVLGEAIGLGDAEITAIHQGGVVHDIGKVGVPDDILLKPGPLSEAERRIIERHPLTGAEICGPIRSMRMVLPIIRHHHEHLDGSGYPDHLHGNEIPMTARVMQVVDVFDAMTSDRPYRKARPVVEAMGLIREEAARGWWDRDVVETFGAILAERDDWPLPPKAAREGEGRRERARDGERAAPTPPPQELFISYGR
jgi:putative two-component system response regulator